MRNRNKRITQLPLKHYPIFVNLMELKMNNTKLLQEELKDKTNWGCWASFLKLCTAVDYFPQQIVL